MSAVPAPAPAGDNSVAVSAPAPAGDDSASRVVLRDGPGDVLAGSYPYKNAVRVDRPSVDITRAVARHGPQAVTVRMRFADLRRPRTWHDFRIIFGTPRRGGLRYWLTLETTPKRWRGHVSEFEDIMNDHLVRCPRLTHHIDYATDVVRIRMPRRCLGTPAWVRVHIENELIGRNVDVLDSAHDRDRKWFDPSAPGGPRSTRRLSPP